MSVIVMQVISAEAHPNADALRVYRLETPEITSIQVVANLENVYQVGDTVAIAQVGSELLDGLTIRRATLRGVESFGMAMGLVEESVGTDLSEQYCQPKPTPEEIASGTTIKENELSEKSTKTVRWSKIEQLHHVLDHLERRRDFLGESFVFPKIDYRAKVKLDGTNAAVHILSSGEVFAQSRTRIITPQDDNMQFAKWVEQNHDYFSTLALPHPHVILFGEWCGEGIQKRTAISQIDRKIFAIFAVQFGDHDLVDAAWEVEPEHIRSMLPAHPDVFVLPWASESIHFDFAKREQLKSAADDVNQMVLEVEKTDPWVSEVFGIQGIGEGVVMYPVLESTENFPILRESYSDLMFKAKGEKHRVVKQKEPAQLDPEVAANISAFVDMFVTEARLEQAAKESCQDVFKPQNISAFIKWMGQDIKQEGQVELKASGLEWKQVSKRVSAQALKWFKKQIAEASSLL